MKKWQTVGTAVREFNAIRFDVIAERGRGVYYVAADLVSALFAGDPVPVVVCKGKELEHAGHVELSSTGKMFKAQLSKDGAHFQVPAIALREHYDENHGTPTYLSVPPPPVPESTPEPAPLPKGVRYGVV
jgi:hypothetical protein